MGHGHSHRRHDDGRHGADHNAPGVVHGRKCHCACLPGQEETVAEDGHLEEEEGGQPGGRGGAGAGVDAGQLCLRDAEVLCLLWDDLRNADKDKSIAERKSTWRAQRIHVEARQSLHTVV